MKKISLLFIAIISFSCKNPLYIKVLDPAPVTIHSTIKKIGIINKTTPSDDNKTLNTIHTAISGEGMAMIKEGSAQCIKGLKEELIKNNRFDTTLVLDKVDLKTPVIGVFPTPIPWDQVEKICRENNVDVLFVLELFDTELKMAPISLPTGSKNILDVVSSVQQQTSLETVVKTGWRIYDPKNKSILDQYNITRRITSQGGSLLNTAEALIGRKEAVKNVSYESGQVYSDRILPYWIKVHRKYYIRGTNNFKVAKRKARLGDWEGAAKLWSIETKSNKRKICGRACYNMAIYNEIIGDLDNAIEWDKKAYSDYRNRQARFYINVLKNRKIQNSRLQSQSQ